MFETTPSQTLILEAARSLVRESGYAVVSLRQIAAAAGYSPAGLYAHFPGREAILDAVADRVRVELGAALEAALAGAEPAEPAEQLASLGQAYVGFALAHPAEFELLFRFTASRRRSLQDPTPSPIDVLRRIAQRALPEAGAEELEVACLAFWSTVHGLANLRLFHLADFPGDWDGWLCRILRRQAEVLTCQAP